jgi:hypothetical protein
MAGLGKIDKGQLKGFYIHPVLAIDAVTNGCYGIASLEFVKRAFKEEILTRGQRGTIRNSTAFEEKESYRWFSSIKKALTQCVNAATKTVIADRDLGFKQALGIYYYHNKNICFLFVLFLCLQIIIFKILLFV